MPCAAVRERTGVIQPCDPLASRPSDVPKSVWKATRDSVGQPSQSQGQQQLLVCLIWNQNVTAHHNHVQSGSLERCKSQRRKNIKTEKCILADCVAGDCWMRDFTSVRTFYWRTKADGGRDWMCESAREENQIRIKHKNDAQIGAPHPGHLEIIFISHGTQFDHTPQETGYFP